MAVDKGYGSGKPRSAANSADRRTKAASANLRKKNIQKVASKPFQKQRLASVGKQAAAGFNIGGRQYLETGVSRWANAATIFSRAAKAKGSPPDASKMLPAPRPMLPARRGTPPDASKMIPAPKPKPSTKALRDYRSTGRPPSKPGSMEGWQGIQNVRKSSR